MCVRLRRSDRLGGWFGLRRRSLSDALEALGWNTDIEGGADESAGRDKEQSSAPAFKSGWLACVYSNLLPFHPFLSKSFTRVR